MPNSKVVTLTFEIHSSNGISYSSPPQVNFANHLGAFQVTSGLLEFRPAEIFDSVDEAVETVSPFLRAWEIDAAIRRGLGSIEFRFRGAETVDLDPKSGAVSATGSTTIKIKDSALGSVTRLAYPSPPLDLIFSADLNMAYRRWKAVQEDKESLLAFSYLLYTILVPGGIRDRRQASRIYAIDEQVLRKLAELSSTGGDADSIRKVSKQANLAPLSDAQRGWLEEASKRLVLRIGQHAAGGVLQPITLSDLPPI